MILIAFYLFLLKNIDMICILSCWICHLGCHCRKDPGNEIEDCGGHKTSTKKDCDKLCLYEVFVVVNLKIQQITLYYWTLECLSHEKIEHLENTFPYFCFKEPEILEIVNFDWKSLISFFENNWSRKVHKFHKGILNFQNYSRNYPNSAQSMENYSIY